MKTTKAAAPLPLLSFSPFLLCAFAATLALNPAHAADPVIETFQKALFEEEANQNYDAAIRAYTEVVGKLDEQRKLAATALFRLAECYRKLGRSNDAITAYQRVVRDFPDQSKLVELSRTYGSAPAGSARTLPAEDRVKLKDLLQQELRIAEKFLAEQKEQAKIGRIASGDETRFERDVLGLKRQLLAVDGFTDPEVRSQWRALLLEEIKLAEKAAQLEKAKLDVGRSVPAEVARLQRDILTLKRELITFDATPAAQPVDLSRTALSRPVPQVGESASGSSVSDEEEKEIRRIRALIQDSPDLINARNASGVAPLHSAAGAGYARVIRFLLESGADPNLKSGGGGNNGQTALHFAARNGHKSVVDLLLEAKADAAARDASGNTPLHFAALHGYRLIVERLLAVPVPINGRNVSGITPLHNAVGSGHQSVADLLFKKGADLNMAATGRVQTPSGPEVFEGYTPLHTAVVADQIGLIRWLNTNGANVNAAGPERRTPLHLAARNNNVDAIRALIRGGLDLDAADTSGQTPLQVAVSGGKLNAAELLLEAGANPNGNSAANTPLLHTAGESEELLRLLIRNKANLEVTNRNGRPLLLHLVENVVNSTNSISILLEGGANPNAGLAGGYLPLHAAAVRASPDITRMLLQHGAEVNAMTKDGITPLYNARNGNSSWRSAERVEQTVALLLAGGADETLQRRRSISVSRRTRGYESGVFSKGTNDLNRHSLFELIVTLYQPNGYYARSLPFPDLEHLVINRALGGGQTTETNLDLQARVASLGCAGDFWLEWGDVVEIPELDHPLPATWAGFHEGFAKPVADCVSRKLGIIIKGRTNSYALDPKLAAMGNLALFNVPSFRLQEVLRYSGLLLTSSDATRVRVSRLDPITNEPRQWVLDTTRLSGANDLWLRNGDLIEVPDLPPGERVTVDQNQPRVIGLRPAIGGQATPLPAPPRQP